MKETTNPTPKSSSVTRAWLTLFAVLAIFLIVNLLTASRSPTVWQDEVLYADPGINLALGNGYTSSAWWFQPAGELFVSNMPGHPLLMAAWVKTFGFSITSVRSMDYVLAAAATALFYWALMRFTGRASPAQAALFTCALMGGFGFSFDYRSARPDMIGIVICAAILVAWTIPRAAPRLITLMLLGILLPLCGLQHLPYLAIVGVIVLYALGLRRALPPLMAIGIGVIIGGIGWIIFVKQVGLWERFLTAMRITDAPGKQGPMIERVKHVAAGFVNDISAVAVAGALVIIAFSQWRSRSLTRRSPAILGIIMAIIVPLFVGFTGHFKIYYSWMRYVPMTMLLIASLPHASLWPKRLAVASLIIASLALPLRLGLTLRQWDERDYSAVERFVAQHVRSDDIALCYVQAYYPTKKLAASTYTVLNLDMMSDADRRRVTVMLINPDVDHPQKLTDSLGGEWKRVDELISGSHKRVSTAGLTPSISYHLVALRRVK